MAHEEQGLGLGTDQLFALLQQKLLPVLPVQDMIRLMATSQILRNMVMNADIGTWHTAVQQQMPWQCKLPNNVPAVLQLLKRQHTVATTFQLKGMSCHKREFTLGCNSAGVQHFI